MSDYAGTFKLKCVSCEAVEERPAEECREQPFCKKCFSPMVLDSVRAKLLPAKRKRGAA